MIKGKTFRGQALVDIQTLKKCRDGKRASEISDEWILHKLFQQSIVMTLDNSNEFIQNLISQGGAINDLNNTASLG